MQSPANQNKIPPTTKARTLLKTAGFWVLKLLVLFLLLDLGLRAGEQSLWHYNFRHKAEKLPHHIWDIHVRLRVHKITEPKAPGEIRMITIGNSAINGAGLQDHESFARQLQDYFEQTPWKGKVKVYNLGVNAACTLDEFLLLRAAAPYQIDYVIWGLTLRDFYTPKKLFRLPVGDLNRNFFLKQENWFDQRGYKELFQLFDKTLKTHLGWQARLDLWAQKHWALWRNQELLKEILLDQFMNWLPEGLQEDVINTFWRPLAEFVYFPSKRLYKGDGYPWPNPNFRYLGAIKELLDEQGSQLVLFDQPTIFHDYAYPPGWIKHYREAMKEIIPPLGVYYQDLIDLVPPGRENFNDYLHLTGRGHKKVTQVMGDFFIQEIFPRRGDFQDQKSSLKRKGRSS